jgi:hypothetical protein
VAQFRQSNYKTATISKKPKTHLTKKNQSVENWTQFPTESPPLRNAQPNFSIFQLKDEKIVLRSSTTKKPNNKKKPHYLSIPLSPPKY